MAESRNQIWVGESLYHELQDEQKGNSMPATIRSILEERNRLRQEKKKLLEMLAAKKKVNKCV